MKNITGVDAVVKMNDGNFEVTNVEAVFIYATTQEKSVIIKDENSRKENPANYKNLLMLTKKVCTETLHIPIA